MFDKRLLIITGKGGVGKSTVSMGIAKMLAKSGKKILIIQTDLNENGISSISTTYKKKVSFRKEKLEENIWACSINPYDSMEEYFTRILHIPSVIFSKIFRNNMIKAFMDAIPGIREIFIIGKIWYEAFQLKAKKGGELEYDCVIWDAPQSGRVDFFLQIPQIMITALKLGPIVKACKEMKADLENKQKTAMVIVSIPEEMAINETNELIEDVIKHIRINIAGIVLNFVFDGCSEIEAELLPCFHFDDKKQCFNGQIERAVLEELLNKAKLVIESRYQQKYKMKNLKNEQFNINLVKIPFITPPEDNRKDYTYMLISDIANLLGREQ